MLAKYFNYFVSLIHERRLKSCAYFFSKYKKNGQIRDYHKMKVERKLIKKETTEDNHT